MRHGRTGIGWVAAALFSAAAQQAPQPSFRAGATLVEFALVALDDDGRPVTDLRADEIRIVEHGHVRPAAFFRFQDGMESAAPEPLAPGVVTNRPEYSGTVRHTTAILLDQLNTPPGSQAFARDQVRQYLSTLPPETRLYLFRLASELSTVADTEHLDRLPSFFSNDVADLECIAFLRSPAAPCAGRRTLSEGDTMYYQMAAEHRIDATLAALRAIADHLAAIPGRKNLIWIGSGIPVQSFTGDRLIGGLQSGFKSYEERIRATAQHLAGLGIAVYPVDAKGVARSGVRTAGGLVGNVVSNYQPEAANNLLADVTGGRVVRLTNDLAAGMRQSALDQSASYRVGFYRADSADDRWHSLDVKSLRRGVRLFHRQGFLADAFAQPRVWSDNEWRSVIASPLPSTAIRLDAHLEAIVDSRQLLLQMASDDLHFRSVDGRMLADVEVGIAEKNATGAFAYRVKPVRVKMPAEAGRGALYSERWKIGAGTVSLRLVVRDRYTARSGALDLRVD